MLYEVITQVNGGKFSALEGGRQRLVAAQQGARTIVVALSLDDASLADGAQLADSYNFV